MMRMQRIPLENSDAERDKDSNIAVLMESIKANWISKSEMKGKIEKLIKNAAGKAVFWKFS